MNRIAGIAGILMLVGCTAHSPTQSVVPVPRAPEVYQLTINAEYARAHDCGRSLKSWQTIYENVVGTELAEFEFAYKALECSNLEISEDTIYSVKAAFFSKPGESLLSQKRKMLKRQAFVDGVVRLSSNTTKSSENKAPKDEDNGCYDVLGEQWCAKSRY